MATKLYLRTGAAPETTPATQQSTTMPVGTTNNQTWATRKTAFVAGLAQDAGNITTLAQTARQDASIKPWISPRLAAQVIPAATWTFAFSGDEANTNANAKIVPIVYVWRPSDATKVGTIYDNSTALGTEWAAAATGVVVTFSGASVTCLDEDHLVFEVWATYTQAMATSYVTNFNYGGTDDPVEGVAISSAAAYFETPDNLMFLISIPVIFRPRHPRNTLLRR